MAFKGSGLFETEEAEAARLAQSPEGSTTHRLSAMPVQIPGDVRDMLIELPHFDDEPRRTIVVIPLDSYHHSHGEPEARPWRRYNRSWTCAVVASNHPSYPVGGHRVTLPEAELVRGTQRTLDI